MRAWRVGVLIWMVGLFGCGPNPRGAEAARQPPASVTATVASSNPTGSLPPPDAASPPIGFAALPPDIPNEAHEANGAGLRAHRAGDYVNAKRLFADAVRLAPGFLLARYNLACAKARSGELDVAERDLDDLLTQDLPSYARRYEADPDFALLRASPAGARLRVWIAELSRAWSRAELTGVPSVLWKPAARQIYNIPVTRYLRVGVYLPEARRFVPMAPEVLDASSGYLDPASHHAVVLSAPVNQCQDAFCPHIDSARAAMYSTSDFVGSPLVYRHDRMGFFSIRAQAGESSLRVAIHDCGIPFPSCDSGWMRVDERGTRHDVTEERGSGFVFYVDEYGTALTNLAPGFRVAQGKFVGGLGSTPVSLDVRHAGATHESVVATADGATALVVTTHDGCNCVRGEAIFNHAVSRVDVGHQRAELLFHGEGHATASIDGAGAVYLQRGAELVRFSDVRAMREGVGEPLMAGLLLAVPRKAITHCCSD